jgi:chemotaxis protein CheX
MENENPILNAFLTAARDTLSTMAMLEIEVEGYSTHADKIEKTLDYSTVVGLTGEKDGVLVITLTAALAKQVVGAMLGMDESELDENEDILDGVGELGNMVAGGAKTALQDSPHHFDLALPTTIRGDEVVLQPKSGTPGLIIQCNIGSEAMRIGIWKHGVTDNISDESEE